MPFTTAALLAAAALLGLAILARTALTAWNGWLDLKRAEMARPAATGTIHALGMIDLSDIKERLRKLEAIAAGVDL
jgi:Spy/CpxP family protein refolding chaperone